MSSLLETRELSKRFVKHLDFAAKLARKLGANVQEEVVQAVDQVNLDIRQGEVVGLVGESGCGKSTFGRMVTGILPPSAGTIHYNGKDISNAASPEGHAAALKIQMIFQDPFASLNPRMRVRDIIGEAPRIHGLLEGQSQDEYVANMLEKVGLDASYSGRYPHQFSGGQRQRLGVARALAVQPEFLVCDEAVAALDVSIQAQVLNLFMDLREQLNLTYLFISHDLSVVEHISN
ncbi:MAG: ATP-binding cassette domain-containing protein, partial [SAR324 cluster bacterium]|nr:ATP-binding cassette domain-containing protein [SAR324 cluster bacterium]